MSFPKDTPEEHRDGVGMMCERFARPGGMGQGAKQSPVFKQNYPPKMPGDCSPAPTAGAGRAEERRSRNDICTVEKAGYENLLADHISHNINLFLLANQTDAVTRQENGHGFGIGDKLMVPDQGHDRHPGF